MAEPCVSVADREVRSTTTDAFGWLHDIVD